MTRVRVESILMQELDQLRRKQQRVDDLGLRMELTWRAAHRVTSDRWQQLAARLQRQDIGWRTVAARERLVATEDGMRRLARERLRSCREREAGLARELAALSPSPCWAAVMPWCTTKRDG